MDQIIKAIEFATKKHEGQMRKERNRPYIYHPLRVMGQVMSHPVMMEFVVIAAVLHDTLEDTDTTLEELIEEFGENVAYTVKDLSHIEYDKDNRPNRAKRLSIERARLRKCVHHVKFIKLCDRVDNLRDMLHSHNPKWMKTYCGESILLLKCLKDTDELKEKELSDLIGKVLHRADIMETPKRQSS